MVEHHDDHSEVEGVSPEREAVAIALDTLEVTFRPGDTEHGNRGIQGHDAIRRREQVCEPAGPAPKSSTRPPSCRRPTSTRPASPNPAATASSARTRSEAAACRE